ncbi:MAG: hypothetical protein HUU20_06510 [Pirellulales bacterium]|nr:hypothetical protein [Pirellulales bacterium]
MISTTSSPAAAVTSENCASPDSRKRDRFDIGKMGGFRLASCHAKYRKDCPRWNGFSRFESRRREKATLREGRGFAAYLADFFAAGLAGFAGFSTAAFPAVLQQDLLAGFSVDFSFAILHPFNQWSCGKLRPGIVRAVEKARDRGLTPGLSYFACAKLQTMPPKRLPAAQTSDA